MTKRRTPVKPEPPDEFELDRRRRARAEIEELALRGRQRPDLTTFATEVVPELGALLLEQRAREDQRIQDERAGRPTVPFAEMNASDAIAALASYDHPEDYPPELEQRIQRIVDEPPPKLSPSARSALLEIVHIRQRVLAGTAAPSMIERLHALTKHRDSTVKFEACRLMIEIAHPPEEIEEMKPTRALKPKRPTRRN